VSARARGLGRGLDALLPKVEQGSQRLALDQLVASELQPRREMDPAALADLAASVGSKGVLQPLLVRPRGAAFEIVAGERRFRAAQQAGLTHVPVIVRDLSDQEALEIAIIENLQREDLNALDEAEAFQQLLGFGLSQEEVAEAVGKNRSTVANSLRLLTLPDEARVALSSGRISAGHGRAILAMPGGDREWALKQIVDRGLSVRQAESLRRVPPRQPRTGTRHSILAEELTRFAGTKVSIHGDRRGRIELHFHSEDELQRLLDLLGFEA